jgi:hypothetical protein
LIIYGLKRFGIKGNILSINLIKSPSDRVGVSQVLPQETRNSAPTPTQVPQTFVTNNNMKFADTKTKRVIRAEIIKTI